MEAASWLAGEPWSDRPRSVHPAIAAVARWVNDNVDDNRRQNLWPLILASVGTAARHRPLTWWRLHAAAIKARHSARSDPPQAWRQVLDRYQKIAAPRRPVKPTNTSVVGGWPA